MKTKNIISAFFLCFFFGSIYSQDIITKKSGEDIKSKVIEITPTEVKYKKYENQNGPAYSILKSDILIIRYENGTKDIFNEEKLSIENKPSVTPVKESTSNQPEIETKPNRIGIYANPLGFVQFGPFVGTEITRNSNLIIDFHVRFSSLGLLMYDITSDTNDGNPYSISGLGLGGGVKAFLPSRIGGIYIGGIVEYGWLTCDYAQNEPWNWQKNVRYVPVYCNAGYKFRFPSGFYINTGLYLGFEYTFYDQWNYTKDYNGDNSVHQDGTSTKVFGMVEASFGFEF